MNLISTFKKEKTTCWKLHLKIKQIRTRILEQFENIAKWKIVQDCKWLEKAKHFQTN